MPNHAVFIPLVTPLDDAGAVCRQSVGHLLECSRLTASGYVPCLTSGEGWLLSSSQWEAMVRFTLELAGPRDVIVGIERPTTDEVIEHAQLARRLGARAVMLTSPFKAAAGHAIDQPSIFEHYRRVHDASGLDIYLYNESSLSGNVTMFETLLAVAELPRVVGIKDSVEGGREPSQIAALQRHGLAYYVGWEHQLAKGLPVDGCVVSLANLEPALCRLGLSSAEPAVHAEVVRLTEAYSLLSEDWYRHVKRALKARGVIASDRTVAS
jgi:4-hydroxy-tetrahydrodipicolinate synthase